MKLHISSRTELIRAIKEHEIISYDVFDTLIMRKTLYPEDVFEIVQARLPDDLKTVGFVQNRKRAVLENEIPNPDIYQIYHKFAVLTGLSDKDKDIILTLELEVEKRVLIARHAVVEIMDLAKQAGKKVYLITDMYLPANIIREILSDLGISGYDDILVSCDYKTLKSEELFDRFKEKYPGGSYLHIGDHPYADVECAGKRGMDAMLLDSAFTMFQASVYAKANEDSLNAADRNVLGMFVANWFQNPFGVGSSRRIGLAEVARFFVAPLVYCMLADIRQTVFTNSYDGILFASRDGYLFRELYDRMRDESFPTGIYFYTSRKSVVAACLKDTDTIMWMSSLPFDYDTSEIFSKVFLLEGREYDSSEGLEQNILNAVEEIVKKSLQLKENYKIYINNLGITSGRYLFVDLAAAGTCQMYLEQIMDVDLEGYYLCKLKTKEEDKEHLKCRSLFQSVQIDSDVYGFYKAYQIIESILTAPEPSLEYFDENGHPVFAEESRKYSEIELLKDMHREIRDYFEDMLYMCKGQTVSAYLIDKLISIFLETEAMDANLHVTLKDDWMNHFVEINLTEQAHKQNMNS